MSRQGKFVPTIDWRIVAAFACVAFAADPSLAAGRHHAPHAHPPAAQGGGSQGGAAAATPEAKSDADNGRASAPIDSDAPKRSAGADKGSKATGDGKSVGPIDLTRPDDGYGNHENLRRRAARTALIAAQKKKLQVAPSTNVAAHPPGAAGVTDPHPRNSAGAVLPSAVTAAKPEPIRGEPAGGAFGSARNNLGLGTTDVHATATHVIATPAPKTPVVGINGTSLHHADTGIGGPAKDHSATAGSTIRRKF